MQVVLKNVVLRFADIFEAKEFKENWEATGISVLRHNKKNWDVIFTANFTEA